MSVKLDVLMNLYDETLRQYREVGSESLKLKARETALRDKLDVVASLMNDQRKAEGFSPLGE